MRNVAENRERRFGAGREQSGKKKRRGPQPKSRPADPLHHPARALGAVHAALLAAFCAATMPQVMSSARPKAAVTVRLTMPLGVALGMRST